MAVNLNKNYNDETTLDEYYPIIKQNLDLLADETVRLDDVKLEEVPANSVGTTELKNKSVTGAKIADKTVTAGNIADYAIGQNQLAQACIPNNRIQNGAVDDRCIASKTITSGKLAFAPFTVISAGGASEYANPNYCIETGIYMFSGISGGMGSGEGFPAISGTPGTTLTTGALYVVRLAFQVTQLFVSLGPHAAVRSFFLTSEGEASSFGEWKIIDEIPDGAVTAEKIADGTITEDKLAEGVIPTDGAASVYSGTPKQIGKWIDNTPIWRVAFDEVLETTSEDEIGIKIAKSEENIRLLRVEIYSSIGYNTIDTNPVYNQFAVNDLDSESHWVMPNSDGILNIYIPSAQNPENRVYGVIEYVTPESNLP